MPSARSRTYALVLVNAITAMRLVGSLALLALAPLSAPYFVAYAACGASDALDGWIARRAGVTSAFGASFDSVADTVFALALVVSLVPAAELPLLVWLWIAAIVLVKLAALAVGYARFRAYAALHTYANKLAGLALFALPVLFAFAGSVPAAVAVCALATFAALEELVLTVKAPALDPNVKGVLGFRRKR